MACGHCFHIGCLARWLVKNESCPYCRHEANEQERIEEDKEEDESTEYEEEDEEEEQDTWVRVGRGRWITVRERQQRQDTFEIPEFDEEAHALWVFRKTMELVESGEPVSAQKDMPAAEVKLPEVSRGFWEYLSDPHDGYETD